MAVIVQQSFGCSRGVGFVKRARLCRGFWNGMADDIKERNDRTLHEHDGEVKVGMVAYLGVK
jgi:hypothetical protein